VLSRKRRLLYICKERRERGVLNQPPTGIFVVCTSRTEAWHVARPLCQPHTMVDAQADGGAGQTLSSPRYSTRALWTARETGGRRVFRRSTAPLENHIKNTETHPVSISYAHTGKKEDKSRHFPAPARALHHPTATPKKRNAQAAGQPPAAVAVTWAWWQHAAGVVGSHGRGAAQGGQETAANGRRRGGRRHRWGADRRLGDSHRRGRCPAVGAAARVAAAGHGEAGVTGGRCGQLRGGSRGWELLAVMLVL